MLSLSKTRQFCLFRQLVSSRNHSLKSKNAAALVLLDKVQGQCQHNASFFSSQYARLNVTATAPYISRHRAFHSSTRLYEEIRVVLAPNFAESVTEGDIRWEKAVGDSVNVDELVGEIETDKTNMPVLSPTAGVIEELLVEDGSTVNAGASLFKLRVGAAGGTAAAAKATSAAVPPPPPSSEPEAVSQPPPSSTAGAIPDSPPAPSPVPTGPLSSVPKSSVTPKAAAAPSGSTRPGAAPTTVGGTRSEQRVKMNRMRQRIGQRLKDAQNSCAMLTTFNEIDMSNVIEMRSKYKAAFLKKYNLKFGFMSAFVKAAGFALQDQPVVNAVIDGMDIVYRDFIDISVAVATTKGLVVPVIRSVESMNYADIERTIADLGERARAGTLAIEDMDGGTFTISNGGVFGSMFGTPIINPPQSAILGMHGIFERPIAVNGKVEIRPMMYVALTYDHKLIDGREAVTFLRKIKSAVEDPRVILLDL